MWETSDYVSLLHNLSAMFYASGIPGISVNEIAALTPSFYHFISRWNPGMPVNQSA